MEDSTQKPGNTYDSSITINKCQYKRTRFLQPQSAHKPARLSFQRVTHKLTFVIPHQTLFLFNGSLVVSPDIPFTQIIILQIAVFFGQGLILC
jgi:hypothetical protein